MFLGDQWFERKCYSDNAGTVFAYGVTSSGKTHTMHVSKFKCYGSLLLAACYLNRFLWTLGCKFIGWKGCLVIRSKWLKRFTIEVIYQNSNPIMSFQDHLDNIICDAKDLTNSRLLNWANEQMQWAKEGTC